MQPGKAQHGRRRKAHTLVELLVASTLFLMLLGTMWVALVQGNRYVRNAETKVQAQTEALAASIWLTRNLTESNVTATVTNASPVGVSFPSPRDPHTGDVAWASNNVGALMWRQIRFVYFDSARNEIMMKGFPLEQVGLTPTVVWSGFPPFPANGVVDLSPAAPQPFPANILTIQTPINKTVARSIRQLVVDIYQPTAPAPQPPRSASLLIESFVPAYDLNYGVQIRTTVRMQN